MITSEADVLIPIKRVARSLGLSPATIAKMSARGDFPPAVDLGVRKKIYLLSHIEAWWKERLGGLNGQPFPLAPARPGESIYHESDE